MKHKKAQGLLILATLCWVNSGGLVRGHGGHGGGGHGGHGGNFHHGGFVGFYGFPYGYGFYGFGYPAFYGYGYPGFYGYGYPGLYGYGSAGIYGYPYPPSGYPVPGPQGPFDPDAHPLAPSPNGGRGLPVTVTLKVPANAEVWFNGAKTTQTGTVRQFQSPPVEPGATFEYEIRVTWQQAGQPVTQTRHVTVRAGQNVDLDFRTRIAPPQP